MNERDPTLEEALLCRAVDGELTEEELVSWNEMLRKRPDLREAFERACADRERADLWSTALRSPQPGLEESVLTALGHPSRNTRRLAWVAMAAALLLACGAAWWLGKEDEIKRRSEHRPTASFSMVDGSRALERSRGVFFFREGQTDVSVEEPTLVETPIGQIELEPGRFEISVKGGDITVWAREGKARIRTDAAQVDVPEGKKVGTNGVRAVTKREVFHVGNEPTKPTPELPATVRVFGVVRDGVGEFVSGATVYGLATNITTNERGQFDGMAAPGAWIGVRHAERAPPMERRVPSGQTTVEWEFVLDGKGGTLRARVVDKTGRPIVDATVVVGGSSSGRAPHPAAVQRIPSAVTAKTDSNGDAVFQGVKTEWGPIRVVAPGFAPYQGWVRVAPDGETLREFPLSPAGVVTGTVVDSDGNPVEGVIVSFRQAGSAVTYRGIQATTDAAGAFRIENAPVGRVEIVAASEQHGEARAWMQLEGGKPQAWSATLEPRLAIWGRIVDEAGVPQKDVEIECRRLFRGAGATLGRIATKEDGVFEFPPQLDVAHELWVWNRVGRRARMTPPDHKIRFLPSESPRDLVIDRGEEEEPGWLRGTMLLSDGGAAAEARVRAWPDGQPGWRLQAKADANGAFRIGPLRPGRYTLEIHRDGEATLHRSGIEVPEGEEVDLGAQRFVQPGRIHAKFVDKDGEPYSHALHVFVSSLDQRIRYSVQQHGDGSATSETLAPGRYLVSGAAPGLIEEVEVRSGETTEANVVVRGGKRFDVEFQLADGTAPREVRYEVRDDKGRLVLSGTLDHHDASISVWLVSGTYRLTARDARHKGEARVEIESAKGTDVVERLTLTLQDE